MKIFNWVHRKLNGQPSSVAFYPKKAEVKISQLKVQREDQLMEKSGDADTEALLGWREGLLAIGTLGLHADPHPDFVMISNFSFRKTNSVFDYPNDSFKDEEYVDATTLMERMLAVREEDENPLVLSVYDNHKIKDEDNQEEEDLIEPIKTEEDSNKRETSVKGDHRTTLADLFKADPADEVVVSSQKCVAKPVSILKENEGENEQLCKQKKFPVVSFPGKLIRKLTHSYDADPVKRINKMMRKVIKRKIHPELLRQKSATGTLENQVNELQASEGMSLLQSELVPVNK